MSTETPEYARHLPIEGTLNFRDVGGYPTAHGGAIRWRTLFRSDSLHGLHPAGLQSLVDLGVRSSIDLRDEFEVRAEPSPLSVHPRFAYVHVPTEAWPRLAAGALGTAGEFYVHRLENADASLLTIMEVLAGRDTFPAVINCNAGKDRTGLVIALLLGLAGVSRSLVIEDYVLTRQHASEPIPPFEETRLAYIREWMLDCPPEPMEAALDHLDQHYGGAEGYVRDIGLPDDAIRVVRSALVEL